jgi:hypothetical protein
MTGCPTQYFRLVRKADEDQDLTGVGVSRKRCAHHAVL